MDLTSNIHFDVKQDILYVKVRDTEIYTLQRINDDLTICLDKKDKVCQLQIYNVGHEMGQRFMQKTSQSIGQMFDAFLEEYSKSNKR